MFVIYYSKQVEAFLASCLKISVSTLAYCVSRRSVHKPQDIIFVQLPSFQIQVMHIFIFDMSPLWSTKLS